MFFFFSYQKTIRRKNVKKAKKTKKTKKEKNESEDNNGKKIEE